MFSTYSFLLDGEDCSSYGLVVEKRHDESVPEADYTTYSIPGMDGDFVVYEGTYRCYNINIICNFVSKNETLWHDQFRKIKKWLLRGGQRELVYSDDLSYYRKVIKITIDSTEREFIETGRVSINFTLLPYEYLIGGKQKELIGSGLIQNIYSTSKPKYILTGEGMAQLIVNNNMIEVNISGSVCIDTDLQLVYSLPDKRAISFKGDPFELYLQEGANIITITQGIRLEMIPNWRCI